MFEYSGAPDPRVWAQRRDLEAAFAKIKSLEARLSALEAAAKPPEDGR